MYNLGLFMQEDGSDEQAQVWFRKAQQAGLFLPDNPDISGA